MPVTPTLFERIGLLHVNAGPGPMLDLAGALTTRAVATALELGVFEALADGPRADLPAALGVPGLAPLVEALVATHYLTHDGDRVALTDLSRTWLLRSSDRFMGDLFPYMEDVLARWSTLAATLRNGGALAPASAWLDATPGAWERYHRGLRAVARVVSAEVFAAARLPPTARTLLDMGGSHGAYSVAACRANPGLTATIVDGPSARPIAEETIGPLSDRVRFVEGDLRAWDGPAADLVFAFNFVRLADDLADVLHRLRACVAPGGRLVILDELGTPPHHSFAHANDALVRLELFHATQGRTYTAAQLVAPLRQAGFTDVTLRPLKRAAGLGVIVATPE